MPVPDRTLSRRIDRIEAIRALPGATLLGGTLIGGLAGTGFNLPQAWPITLLALAVAIDGLGSMRTYRSIGAFAFGLGLGQSLVSLSWIASAFRYQSEMPTWVGYGGVTLLAAYLSLFWAGAMMAARSIAGDHRLRLALALTATFPIAEWVRGHLFSGFAWNPLGMIWLSLPPIARFGSDIGALGLSALLILAAGLIAALRHHPLASPLALVTLALGAAFWPHPDLPPDTRVQILVVQPDIRQGEKIRSSPGRQIRRYLSLMTAPRTTGKRLVFWPEAAIDDFADADPSLRRLAASMLKSGDLLITGALGRDVHGKPTNSNFILDSQGRIKGRYDKRKLVPFGEYLPFRKLLAPLGIARLVQGEADFVAGRNTAVLSVAGLGMASAICYEITFPNGVSSPDPRPFFIFNPSNDAWFDPPGPWQHLEQARLRAIEQGLPLVRATPTGVSAVIRADGSILAAVKTHEDGTIATYLPARMAATTYARQGDWPLLAVAALTILGLALRRDRRTTR
jgi:apolipoprotein N-acyltransferase